MCSQAERQAYHLAGSKGGDRTQADQRGRRCDRRSIADVAPGGARFNDRSAAGNSLIQECPRGLTGGDRTVVALAELTVTNPTCELETLTVRPPLGAAWPRVTVPVSVLPLPISVLGRESVMVGSIRMVQSAGATGSVV